MSIPRFVQIHTLHSYPAALLNRDDAGLAKRLPLGDAVRTRISSQCLKRHWRTAEDKFSLESLGVPMSVRSRMTLGLIRSRLIEQGVSEQLAQAAAEALRAAGLLDKGAKEEKEPKAEKDPKGAKKPKEKDPLATGQAVLLGVSEIEFLVSMCKKLAGEFPDEETLRKEVAKNLREQKANIETMKHGSGLESALFGRMVTSDVLAARDAAVHVAHAFTVHEAQVESDYFTVVDDLLREAGETGSAGIFDTELASGLYYGYVVIDIPQLVANLEGIKTRECFGASGERRALAAQVVRNLIHLIATVTPGAKKGSTAPYGYANLTLVEIGDWQPRTLAGAFQNAVPLRSPNLREETAARLWAEADAIDSAYGTEFERRFTTAGDAHGGRDGRVSLPALAAWVESRIVKGG